MKLIETLQHLGWFSFDLFVWKKAYDARVVPYIKGAILHFIIPFLAMWLSKLGRKHIWTLLVILLLPIQRVMSYRKRSVIFGAGRDRKDFSRSMQNLEQQEVPYCLLRSNGFRSLHFYPCCCWFPRILQMMYMWKLMDNPFSIRREESNIWDIDIRGILEHPSFRRTKQYFPRALPRYFFVKSFSSYHKLLVPLFRAGFLAV